MTVEQLSAKQLETAIDKWQEKASGVTTRLIEAGHTSLTGRVIRERQKTEANKLFDDYVAVNDYLEQLYSEKEARMRWHGSMKPIKRNHFI